MTLGDFYAHKRPTNLGRRSKQLLNQRLLRLATKSHANQSLKVLELGGGHGFFAEACANAGHDYVVIEPHPEMSASLRGQGYRVEQASCPPIPFGSDQFDLVYVGWVLEYLSDPLTAYEFVAECRRVIRPGGTVAIVSSDYPRMRTEFWDVGYNISYATSQRRILQLFYDVGLSRTQTSLFAGNLFGISRYLGYLFNFLYRYRWFDGVMPDGNPIQSRMYKLRFTFPEGVIVVGTK